MAPVECVVRGYITGSGWKDYQAQRRHLRDRAARGPRGVRSSLPEPIFTPATKAEVGDHDENVDFDRAAEIVGDRAAARGAAPALDRALRARRRARARARASSSPTPSSSSAAAPTARSCSATRCSPPTPRASGPPTATSPAGAQPSFDKQYVRDWAAGSGWDKAPPAPAIPPRGRRGHPRALRGRLRADRRRAVRSAGSSGPAA